MSDPIKQMGKGIGLAEKYRDARKIETFFADIFRGKASFEKIDFQTAEPPESKQETEQFLAEVRRFLLEETDPKAMARSMDIPLELFNKMAELGLFALKVPKHFGGKGLSQYDFNRVIELITSCGGPLPIVVSADNSIGAKFPILNFGTDEQKAKFIPELIKWPSGFAFTEKDAGSDATKMKMAAVRLKNHSGETIGYKLTGQKMFITNPVYKNNVPLARFLAVVGKIGDSIEEIREISEDENKDDCFGIFIVPTASFGVEVGQRNKFIGMDGIYNGNPKFTGVFVHASNLIGGEGNGFRIAMQSLNTGRIAIAAGCIAMAKQAELMSIWWGNNRVQFGRPIGRFELIGSGKLAPGAADILAMVAMTKFAALSYDRGLDVRLEAAASKAFASEKMWQIVDNMMQIFGGRGYEAEDSWSRRERALPVSRLFVDARPNRIFEGATELLTQSGARDALDDIFKMGKALKSSSIMESIPIYLAFIGNYLGSFIAQDFDENMVPEKLRTHLYYVEKSSRRLIAAIIKLARKYQDKLAVKQLTTWRLFWIGLHLHAMAVTCRYAVQLAKEGHEPEIIELADYFCQKTIREIEGHGLFDSLSDNDDRVALKIATNALAGRYDFLLKDGIIPFVDMA